MQQHTVAQPSSTNAAAITHYSPCYLSLSLPAQCILASHQTRLTPAVLHPPPPHALCLPPPPWFSFPQKFGQKFDELDPKERQSVGGTIGGHKGGPKGGEARKEQLAAVSVCLRPCCKVV